MTNRAERFDAEPTDDPEDVAVVGSAAPSNDNEAHEDVVRSIRYLLYRHELTSGSDPLPQMIAVVSASAGEGVTTVSQSLAHVLAADRGAEVCWVDMGRSSQLPPAPDRAIQAELQGIGTTVRELPGGQALAEPDPSGIRLVHASEATRTQRSGSASEAAYLDDLLNSIAAQYRYIVFDTPPLLSRVDSIGYLRHAEAYVLVSKQGSTTLNQLRTIAEELRPIPSLGAILNNHRTRTPRFVRRFFRE